MTYSIHWIAKYTQTMHLAIQPNDLTFKDGRAGKARAIGFEKKGENLIWAKIV